MLLTIPACTWTEDQGGHSATALALAGKSPPPYPNFNTPCWTLSQRGEVRTAWRADVQVGGWVWEGGGLRPGLSARRRRSLRISRPEGGERQELELRAGRCNPPVMPAKNSRKELRRTMYYCPPPRKELSVYGGDTFERSERYPF